MDNKTQSIPKEELIGLYSKLYQLVNFSIINESNEDEIQNILRKVIDILITEEIAHPEVFQVFFQLYPPLFLNLLETTIQNINYCLLQQMAFLLPNLKNKNHLIMFISMNFMNRLIRDVSKKQNDENYILHYINFLKYLSFTIDESTIYFFYQKDIFSFPLLDSCLLLYNHSDTSVKNVSRHIILKILKLNNNDVIQYLCSLPFISYFLLLAKQTKKYINKLIHNDIKNPNERNIVLEDIQNDILFIQDMFSIGIEKINYILINVYFGELIIPCLLFLLGKENLNYNEINTYLIEIILYVLWLFVYHIKEKTFLNVLCILLFSDTIINELTSEIIKEIETDQIIEMFGNELDVNGTFEYFLMRNYSSSLIHILCQNKEKELLQVFQNLEFFDFVRTLQNVKNYNKNGNEQELEKIVYQEINNKLKKQLKDDNTIIRVHNIVSRLTGVVIGMSDSNEYLSSVIHLMKQGFPHYHKEGITNKVKLKLINILCHFKLYSQNAIMYLSLILLQIINKEQGYIDNNLLFDLYLKDKFSDNEQIIDINLQDDFNNVAFGCSKIDYGINKQHYNKNNNKINHKIIDDNFHYIYKKGILKTQEIKIQEYLFNSLVQSPSFLSPLTLNIIYKLLLNLPFKNEETKLIYIKTIFKEIIKQIQQELLNKENNYWIFKYTLHLFKQELLNYQTDTLIHLKKLRFNPLFSINNSIDYQLQFNNQFIYPPYVTEILNYRTLLYHFFTHISKFNKQVLLYIQNNSMFTSKIQSGHSIKKEILSRNKIDVIEINFYKKSKVIDNVDYTFEKLYMFLYNFMLCFGDEKISADNSYFIKYCCPIWSIDINKNLNKKEIQIIANIDLDDVNKHDVFILKLSDKEKLNTIYKKLNNEIIVGYNMQYEIIVSLFEGFN